MGDSSSGNCTHYQQSDEIWLIALVATLYITDKIVQLHLLTLFPVTITVITVVLTLYCMGYYNDCT